MKNNTYVEDIIKVTLKLHTRLTNILNIQGNRYVIRKIGSKMGNNHCLLSNSIKLVVNEE